jgi:hypothetical protein
MFYSLNLPKSSSAASQARCARVWFELALN